MALTDLSSFTPRVLTQSVNLLGDGRENFLLNNYFTQRNTRASELIDFGKLQVAARVLMYAREGQEAIPRLKHSGTLNAVKAPHIRQKITLDKEFFKTLDPSLNTYMGPYTDPQAQIAEKVTREQSILRRDADRTMEVQCAQALTTGLITLTFDNGDTATIDMGFTTGTGDTYNIQPDLTGTDLWSSANSNIFKTIETLANQIRKNPIGGYRGPLVCLMGFDAWMAILGNSKLFAMVNNNSNLNLGGGTPSAQQIYKLTLNGIPIYQYSMGYQNKSGTLVEVMDSKSIVLMPAAPDSFSIEFGPVFDFLDPNPVASGAVQQFIQTEYFSKFVMYPDPPITDLIVETNPLALIRNPTAIRIQKVMA